MITKTEQGFALNHWEIALMRLSNGMKVSVREARVVLCKLSGMTHKEAGRAIGSSDRNVEGALQSVYYKTGTDNVMAAVNKLLDEGALHRLPALLLFAITLNALTTVPGTEDDVQRPRGRTRLVTRIVRTKRDEQMELGSPLGGTIYLPTESIGAAA